LEEIEAAFVRMCVCVCLCTLRLAEICTLTSAF